MERLTKRDKNGNAFYAEYGEYLGVHKLADYEDAEEQGRLFKTPIAIGEHLYYLSQISENIIVYTVLAIQYEIIKNKTECFLIICNSIFDNDDEGKRFASTIPVWMINGYDNEDLDRYYINKAEAEAKLAELEEQNEQADKI